jgi:hypothetical protein
MSRRHVPGELRRSTAARADGRCEYCLIHEDDTFYGCEVDHIISEKHGGPTVSENLAYCCLPCNRYKGSGLGYFTGTPSRLVRFFNPRLDTWSDHFILDGAFIRPLTAIGEATERVFKFNEVERLMERRELAAVGRYPGKSAPEKD